MAINEILQWATINGYANMYGNPAHINRMMHDTDFASSNEQTAVYCYLITAAETMAAHDRVTVGVFFARLCDFDFDPKGLLPVQMALMDTAKRMLADLTSGNVIGYDDPVRWQFGYDDFAENVAWVCARVTFMDLAADCVPLTLPEVCDTSTPDDVTDGTAQMYGGTPLSDGFVALCDRFAWSGVSQTRHNNATISVNGEESKLSLSSELITSEVVQEPGMEYLTAYIGKWFIWIPPHSIPEGDITLNLNVGACEFSVNGNFDKYCE